MNKNLIQTLVTATEVIGGHLDGEHDDFVAIEEAREELTRIQKRLHELQGDLKSIVSDLRENGAIRPGGTEQGLLLYWSQELDPEEE